MFFKQSFELKLEDFLEYALFLASDPTDEQSLCLYQRYALMLLLLEVCL